MCSVCRWQPHFIRKLCAAKLANHVGLFGQILKLTRHIDDNYLPTKRTVSLSKESDEGPEYSNYRYYNAELGKKRGGEALDLKIVVRGIAAIDGVLDNPASFWPPVRAVPFVHSCTETKRERKVAREDNLDEKDRARAVIEGLLEKAMLSPAGSGRCCSVLWREIKESGLFFSGVTDCRADTWSCLYLFRYMYRHLWHPKTLTESSYGELRLRDIDGSTKSVLPWNLKEKMLEQDFIALISTIFIVEMNMPSVRTGPTGPFIRMEQKETRPLSSIYRRFAIRRGPPTTLIQWDPRTIGELVAVARPCRAPQMGSHPFRRHRTLQATTHSLSNQPTASGGQRLRRVLDSLGNQS